MNARATFKISVSVFVILAGLALVALAITWAIKKRNQGRSELPAQVFADSAASYHEKAVMHFDSSQFYFHEYETLTQHSDSVTTDSAAFVRLVADYRANLRRVIALEILDSIARQRGEIRAFETAHGDASKKLWFYRAGEPGPEK